MELREERNRLENHKLPGISPDEVVWSALNLSWWQRIVRRFLVQVGIAALIIFWSIPSALVGIISNISYLSSEVPFLHWINQLPEVIKGVIAGLLPAAALAMLMGLVPPICRCTLHPLLFSDTANNVQSVLSVLVYPLRLELSFSHKLHTFAFKSFKYS